MSLPTLSSTPAASPSTAATTPRLYAWLARLGINAEGRRWVAVGLVLLVAGLTLLAWAMLSAKKPAPGVLPDAPPDAAAGPAPSIPLAVKAPIEVVEPAPPRVATPAPVSDAGVATGVLADPRPGLPADVVPGAPLSTAGGPTPAAAPVPAQAASLAADLKALLEQQQRQAERLEHLEQLLGQKLAGVSTQLTRLQAQRSAARRAAATPVALPASAPASAPAPARAQLLAVDLWDGKPSVVIGTDAAGDRRVRFLSEGDRQSDIAVKQASPQEQRAVFDVAGHEVVLERGSGR